LRCPEIFYPVNDNNDSLKRNFPLCYKDYHETFSFVQKSLAAKKCSVYFNLRLPRLPSETSIFFCFTGVAPADGTEVIWVIPAPWNLKAIPLGYGL
jgi:hypothetical protein